MIDGFAFDPELFYLAGELGLRVEPLSVTWEDISGSSVKIGHDSLAMLRNLRSLKRTRYENPVVELERDVDIVAIDQAARHARVQGLVLARGVDNTLLVLARDGALGGLEIATALDGTLRTAGLVELRARTFDAV